MDERVRFVGRLLDGEKMAALCREFAISRKTGYKLFHRYKEHPLGMKRPPEIYTPATRRYRGLPELAYPFHDRVILVTNCGRICLHRKKN